MSYKIKPILIPVFLWIITFCWIGMIFLLSSQNGPQTAKASGGIAKTAAEIIYTAPTSDQIENVHFDIRKLTHVGLFFVLGILLFVSLKSTLCQRDGGLSSPQNKHTCQGASCQGDACQGDACQGDGGLSSLRCIFIPFVLAVFFGSAYGFYDEWHKQFIPGRHFDYTETLINIVSCIAGAVIVLVFMIFRKRMRNSRS